MSGRRLLSASGLERALQCQYWLRDDVEREERQGKSAILGTQVHAMAEAKATGQGQPHMDPRLSEEDAKVARRMYAQWEKWYGGFPLGIGDQGFYEVKVAYRPDDDSARILPNKGPRDYSGADPDTEVTCTVDMVIKRDAEPAPLVEVFDYKTGKHPVPPDAPQLLLQAVAFGALFKTPYLYTYIVRVLRTKVDVKGPHEFKLPAQNAFKASLLTLIQTPINAVEPTLGEQCRFCPARNACPAQSKG